MFTLVITIHVIVCILLIGIILIQAGRGGGLVETLSGVESMFGTKTSALLTRATAILSTLFFITCVGLALLSVRQSRSLMRNVLPGAQVAQQKTQPSPEVKNVTVSGQPVSQNVTPAVSKVESVPAALGQKETGEVPKTE